MLGSSIKLFEVGGTAVRIHPTFFLLLAWIAAVYWINGGPAEAVYGVLFIAILFVCVVLHEFGHIYAARVYGIRTRDVTLLPIGGVAALERMPEKPAQEIFVALAGPAVNLVIAGVLFLLVGGQLDVEKLQSIERRPVDFFTQVAFANIALFVFNLVPAFPMDGGRVLRAVLGFFMDYARATRIAATIGQGLAIVFGVLGLMGNPLLILIALFIFIAASGEAGYVEMRTLTRDFVARDAMISTFEALGTGDDLDAAARKLLETTQQEFPVLDAAGRLRGVLTRADMITALREKGGATPALDIMTRDVPAVTPRDALPQVLKLLQEGQAPVVAVLDDGQRFIGYINSENLNEFLMVSGAYRSRA